MAWLGRWLLGAEPPADLRLRIRPDEPARPAPIEEKVFAAPHAPETPAKEIG